MNGLFSDYCLCLQQRPLSYMKWGLWTVILLNQTLNQKHQTDAFHSTVATQKLEEVLSGIAMTKAPFFCSHLGHAEQTKSWQWCSRWLRTRYQFTWHNTILWPIRAKENNKKPSPGDRQLEREGVKTGEIGQRKVHKYDWKCNYVFVLKIRAAFNLYSDQRQRLSSTNMNQHVKNSLAFDIISNMS